MERHSIDIIGPYPPPFGGISIHIVRIENYLKENQITYRIYNHGYYGRENVFATNKSILWYFKYLIQKKTPAIHFHQFFSFHYIYFYIFSLVSKSKLIVTIHEEKIVNQSRVVRNFLLFFIKRTKFSALIVVSSRLSTYLTKAGVKNILLPAYVPPPKGNFVNINPIGNKDLFLYSIWKLDKVIAQKVYNIELAFEFLSNQKDHLHMLFLIGSKAESDHEYLKGLINRFSVKDSVTVLYEKQLVDYLPNCKFLLRTNNEDGYGVSLQEALDLRIPAIASEVCVRPKGTILFKKGDLADLTDKALNIQKYWQQDIIESPRYHQELINIYKSNLAY